MSVRKTKAQRLLAAARTRRKRNTARAVRDLLKQTNPAGKFAGAAITKLKGGVLKISPIKKSNVAHRRNVEMGFYDAHGFHPIRKSRDYDEDRVESDTIESTRRRAKPKRKKAARRKR